MSKAATTETSTTGTEPATTIETTTATETTPNQTSTTATTTEKTFTQAQLDAEKKKWEKESAKRVAEAEAKAKLTEDEKLKADLADAQKSLRMRDTRDAAVAAAEKAGIKNSRLFYNAYKDELEFDANGKITNLTEVFESAKTESPELFSNGFQGSADGGTGKTPGTAVKTMNDWMRGK